MLKMTRRSLFPLLSLKCICFCAFQLYVLAYINDYWYSNVINNIISTKSTLFSKTRHSVYGKKLIDILRECIASISMVSSPTINKKEAYFSKTLAHFWQSAWFHIPKDGILRVTPFRNSNVTLLMQSLGQYWRYLKHWIRSTVPIGMLCVCSINRVQSGHI